MSEDSDERGGERRPHGVRVVLLRDFGERLAECEPGIGVWAVDTPANRAVAERLWRAGPSDVTVFQFDAEDSPEAILLSKLDAIDLHHGPHSRSLPYTTLEVIGGRLHEDVRMALTEYGFGEFRETREGFLATRPEPIGPDREGP